MLDESEHDRWRATADEKRVVAEDLRRLGHHADACLQFEQAAQLVLKALLRGVGVVQRTHDLVRLAEHVERELGVLGDERLHDALAELSRHYIPARYPDAYDEGTPRSHYRAADADRALAAAEALVRAADGLWGEAIAAELGAGQPGTAAPSAADTEEADD